MNNTWLVLDTEGDTENDCDFNFINAPAPCNVSVSQHKRGTVCVEGPEKVNMDERQEVSGDWVTVRKSTKRRTTPSTQHREEIDLASRVQALSNDDLVLDEHRGEVLLAGDSILRYDDLVL